MNTAEDFIILQGHVYQHNKQKILTIGLSKPAKLKNPRYFLNTPRISEIHIPEKFIYSKIHIPESTYTRNFSIPGGTQKFIVFTVMKQVYLRARFKAFSTSSKADRASKPFEVLKPLSYSSNMCELYVSGSIKFDHVHAYP